MDNWGSADALIQCNLRMVLILRIWQLTSEAINLPTSPSRQPRILSSTREVTTHGRNEGPAPVKGGESACPT